MKRIRLALSVRLSTGLSLCRRHIALRCQSFPPSPAKCSCYAPSAPAGLPIRPNQARPPPLRSPPPSSPPAAPSLCSTLPADWPLGPHLHPVPRRPCSRQRPSHVPAPTHPRKAEQTLAPAPTPQAHRTRAALHGSFLTRSGPPYHPTVSPDQTTGRQSQCRPTSGGGNAVPRTPSLALFYFPSGRVGRSLAPRLPRPSAV